MQRVGMLVAGLLLTAFGVTILVSSYLTYQDGYSDYQRCEAIPHRNYSCIGLYGAVTGGYQLGLSLGVLLAAPGIVLGALWFVLGRLADRKITSS